MKITIDTERMVVEIDSAIKLVDLIKGLKDLLGDEWKKYSIEQKWNNYLYIKTYPLMYNDNTYEYKLY